MCATAEGKEDREEIEALEENQESLLRNAPSHVKDLKLSAFKQP